MTADMEPRAGDGVALLYSLLQDAGARWAFATQALVVAMVVLKILDSSPWSTTLVMLFLAVLLSRGLPMVWGMATAVVAWAFVTGFAYNSYGVLTFATADLVRLVAFTGVVALSCSSAVLGSR